MKQVHFTMYGKGGVGKSLVASLVAQYLSCHGDPVEVINADYLMNECNFDRLFNHLLEVDEDFVVDSGPMSFISLRHYILESDVINLLSKHGKQVVMHGVISDDPHTHKNLSSLINEIPAPAKIIVWLNEFYKEIKGFEETAIYLANKERISGIVRLKSRRHSIFAADIEKMLVANLTFDEANVSPDFNIISKSRLSRVKEDIYRQLEEVA